VIPRADVEIRWAVDYGILQPPSEDDLAYGGFATRGYSRLLVTAATWGDAAEYLSQERQVVARIAATADDAEAFEELAREEEAEAMLWDPDEGPVAAPDLGTFAACLALCAAGCATAASCRGHPGEHAWSHEPAILLTADASRARLVESIARACGCGLVTTDNAKLRLYAQSIEEVLAFAAQMIERRGAFDAMPLPPALASAGHRRPARPEHAVLMRLPRAEIEIYYDVDRGALPTSGVSGVGPGSVLNRDYTRDVDRRAELLPLHDQGHVGSLTRPSRSVAAPFPFADERSGPADAWFWFARRGYYRRQRTLSDGPRVGSLQALKA
jgi:hypothetical protein